MEDIQNEYVCSICFERHIGFGNNPWPVNGKDGERCCDDCNETVVLKARLNQHGLRLKVVS